MKMVRMMGAIALLLPAAAMAQGNQGAGTVNKPASNVAVQMGGVDASFNLKALKVDGSGQLMAAASPKQEVFALVAANVPSAPATVTGGSYILTQDCSAYGSLTLRYQGPDGATMTALLTKTSTDIGGGTLVSLGSAQVVDVTLSGTTGCNAKLARNPQ
jgi:hypothetical protein